MLVSSFYALLCTSFSSWCLLYEKRPRWLRCHFLRGYSQVHVLIRADVSCLLERGAPALLRDKWLRHMPLFPVYHSLWCLSGHVEVGGTGGSTSFGVLELLGTIGITSCALQGRTHALYIISSFEEWMISFSTVKWKLLVFKHRFFHINLGHLQWKNPISPFSLKKGDTWSKRIPQCVL